MAEFVIESVYINDVLESCTGIEDIVIPQRQGIAAHAVVIVPKQKFFRKMLIRNAKPTGLQQSDLFADCSKTFICHRSTPQ